MQKVKGLLYIFVVFVAVLFPTAFAFGATTVGDNVSVGGTLGVTGVSTLTGNVFVTGTLQSTGVLTTYGAVTLGDAYADNITVNGRIASALWASSTLYVGSAAGGDDLVVTNNAVTVGTSVNTSTLAVFGNTTLTGSLLPQTSHNNLYDLGAFGSAWNDLFVSGTLYLNTLTLTGASSEFTVTNVSSTNITASGYLNVYGAVTLGNAVNDDIIVTGRLSTLNISDGSTATSTLTYNSLILGKVLTTFDVGKFYVDSSGDVSASGTLAVFGNTTLGNSDAAAGDTTHIYGALGLGLNPTGSAQLTIQATSSIQTSKFFEIKDIGGTAMAYFSTSTISYTKPDMEAVSLADDALLLTLGNSSHPAVLDLTLDSSAYGGIMMRNTSGMVLSTLDATTLEVTDAAGTVTSTFDAAEINFYMTSGYNKGKFVVDSSGNVSASGTLRAVLGTAIGAGTTCQVGDIKFDTSGIARLCYCSAVNTWACAYATSTVAE